MHVFELPTLTSLTIHCTKFQHNRISFTDIQQHDVIAHKALHPVRLSVLCTIYSKYRRNLFKFSVGITLDTSSWEQISGQSLKVTGNQPEPYSRAEIQPEGYLTH